MKLLLTTIAAVALAGCARWSEADQALVKATGNAGNIEAAKQHLTAGADVNAKNDL
ncbi:MAG: hypothetical protein QF721_11590 [Verrucomicrobiota bacterium]|jgi:hypothetical protein|nr:hypothetical protein [Verrucomicrobiota bacterium]